VLDLRQARDLPEPEGHPGPQDLCRSLDREPRGSALDSAGGGLMRAPLVNFKRLQVATPWYLVWIFMLAWFALRAAVAVVRLLVVAVRHWRLTLPLAAVVYVVKAVREFGAWPVGGVTLAVTVLLGCWYWKARPSFLRFVYLPILSVWRRYFAYARVWRETMTACRLVRKFDGGELLPKLLKVRCTSATDEVVLRMPRGQSPDDWYKAKQDLAYSFEHRHCRVFSTRRAVAPARTGRFARLLRLLDRLRYRDRPRVITLVFIRRDPLTEIVKPFAVPSVPDFLALVIGLREDLMAYALRLIATHVLVVGATRRGKGSVIWSLIRALAAGVKSGLVQLWTIDPKGGMELYMGRPLFARYEDNDFARMADMLDEAIGIMRERMSRLRGKVRVHRPAIGDPLIVIIIDELACLLCYLQDAELKKRITESLALLLTQGAGLGVLVVGATQDPRKEVLSLRDLFPTRIGLGMLEAGHVDLALGEGVRNRGALCDQIPDTPEGKGVGYVILDGQPEPARVRFSFIDDDLIREMAATFPAAEDIAVPAPVAPPTPKQVKAKKERRHTYRPNGTAPDAPLLPPSLVAALDRTSPNGGEPE
jgi:S-DNA-T family DNA segregation ATPase FtsK/SpoIIIE